MKYDLIIIGGGVVGCAIAREASKYKLKCAVIEKEPDVAEEISKANSGVLHAGFNVRPGSLKARFNTDGLRLCPGLAEELDVDYRITGKMVIGKTGSDLAYLERLLAQGQKNGCTGLSIIGKDQIRGYEPQVSAEFALLSESTGIISPFQFTIALAENAASNGVDFLLNNEVTGIEAAAGGFRLSLAGGGTAECGFLVNSAGIRAADIKSMIEVHETAIYPCRGEYYITDREDGSLMNMPIYPVPPADGSGLGVHLTPTCNGNILIGPSADYIDDGEDLGNTADIMTLLRKEAVELMPALEGRVFIKNYSGMRPKLFSKGSGAGFADFIIESSERFPSMINLIGIESPGLTSAPAIAVYVIEELLGSQTELHINPAFNPVRKGITRSSRLGPAELSALTDSDPDYAELICRCEHISRAEILQAVRNPLGAVSLGAVKKRTYSMMGRCQGGFCLPRIIDIIMEETGLKADEIVKSSPGSQVTGRKDKMKTEYGCAIIGAGPAGLAAAVKLSERGMTDFVLVEREAETGGILNQCIHTGFGLLMYREDLTGPQFARRLESELVLLNGKAGEKPPVLRSSMLRELIRTDDGFLLRISSKQQGQLELRAKAVITATGCRERTRENIDVAGSRPAGIFTAGQAQNLINRRHLAPGSRVIIQGSGDIGLIMARRLSIEGFKVISVLERLPWLSGLIRNKVQCLDHFGIPLRLGRQISMINGKDRVSSVTSLSVSPDGGLTEGTEETHECDTVLFAVGLIPELEAVKPAGLELYDRFHPAASPFFESNVEGLFTAGNCLHINDLADSAAAEGTRVAEAVLEFLDNPSGYRKKKADAGAGLPYITEEPRRDLDSVFFSRLQEENRIICIVCPKGCLLAEGDYGCKRGEDYYIRTLSPDGGYSQRVSTTVKLRNSGDSSLSIVPAVSDKEIPVKDIAEAVSELKRIAAETGGSDRIEVTAGGSFFIFNLCRQGKSV